MFRNFTLKCALVALAAAGVSLWTSCSDNGTETPTGGLTPRVELAKGEATTTTLTFTATSWDAEKCAYMVIPADGEAPAAAEILQGGGNFLLTRA